MWEWKVTKLFPKVAKASFYIKRDLFGNSQNIHKMFGLLLLHNFLSKIAQSGHIEFALHITFKALIHTVSDGQLDAVCCRNEIDRRSFVCLLHFCKDGFFPSLWKWSGAKCTSVSGVNGSIINFQVVSYSWFLGNIQFLIKVKEQISVKISSSFLWLYKLDAIKSMEKCGYKHLWSLQ